MDSEVYERVFFENNGKLCCFLMEMHACIDTVIVDGRILKENGVLKSLDTLTGLQMAQEKTEDIWTRFFEDNPKQKALWKESVH